MSLMGAKIDGEVAIDTIAMALMGLLLNTMYLLLAELLGRVAVSLGRFEWIQALVITCLSRAARQIRI